MMKTTGKSIRENDLRFENYLRSLKGLPPLHEQAANFTKAVIAHAADGFRDVDDDELAQRLATCNSCTFLSANERCLKCGCFMKVKAQWRSSVCPVGKW